MATNGTYMIVTLVTKVSVIPLNLSLLFQDKSWDSFYLPITDFFKTSSDLTVVEHYSGSNVNPYVVQWKPSRQKGPNEVCLLDSWSADRKPSASSYKFAIRNHETFFRLKMNPLNGLFTALQYDFNALWVPCHVPPDNIFMFLSSI